MCNNFVTISKHMILSYAKITHLNYEVIYLPKYIFALKGLRFGFNPLKYYFKGEPRIARILYVENAPGRTLINPNKF